MNNDPYEHWQRMGHCIQRCDATTGHAVRDVAFCDTEATAIRLLEAIKKELNSRALTPESREG